MGRQLVLPFSSGEMTIPEGIKTVNLPCEAGQVSDGDHTFEEVYDHRYTLFLALLSQLKTGWYSHHHSDGPCFEGCFIAGVALPSGNVTYHLPNKYLEIAEKYLIKLEAAPAWDGHTPDDVLDRLTDWMLSSDYDCRNVKQRENEG